MSANLPTSPDRLVHLGRSVARRNWIKALEYYRKALDLDPDNGEARLEAADLYYRVGQPQMALKELDVLMKSSPDDPEALFARANILLSLDRAREAIPLYHRVKKILGAVSPEVHYNLALSYRKLGDVERALRAVEHVFEDGHGFDDAYDLAGRLYLDLDRPEEAEAAFRSILAIDPDDIDAHHMVGLALARMGRWAEARAEWEIARDLDPDWDEPYRELGWSAHLEGEDDSAEALLRQALNLNPENVQARIDLGSVLISRKHFKEAASELTRVRETDPGNSIVETMLRDIARYVRSL